MFKAVNWAGPLSSSYFLLTQLIKFGDQADDLTPAPSEDQWGLVVTFPVFKEYFIVSAGKLVICIRPILQYCWANLSEKWATAVQLKSVYTVTQLI